AAFRQSYPRVAAMLSIDDAPPPPPLFEAGTIRYPKATWPETAWTVHLDWSDHLDRLLAGSWGAFGTHDPTPLSDGEAFALGYQSQARRNDHAVLTGRGLIRSRFAVDSPHAPRKPD